MGATPGEKRESRATRFLAALATPLVLLVPFVEWIPWFATDQQRQWAVIVLVILSLIGYGSSQVLARARARRLAELRSEIRAARERLLEVEPATSLSHVSDSLFSEGAWRLTIYAKRIRSADNSETLQRLVSASSDKDFRDGSPSEIRIKDSFFKEVFGTNLANSLYRRPRESGPFRDGDEGFDEARWLDWRDSIFGGPDALFGGAPNMTTRKYVWYATQDPDTKQVFVALAESTEPEGIQVDFLLPPATSAWIVMAARMAGAKSGASEIVERGEESMTVTDP